MYLYRSCMNCSHQYHDVEAAAGAKRGANTFPDANDCKHKQLNQLHLHNIIGSALALWRSRQLLWRKVHQVWRRLSLWSSCWPGAGQQARHDLVRAAMNFPPRVDGHEVSSGQLSRSDEKWSDQMSWKLIESDGYKLETSKVNKRSFKQFDSNKLFELSPEIALDPTGLHCSPLDHLADSKAMSCANWNSWTKSLTKTVTSTESPHHWSSKWSPEIPAIVS